MKYNFMITSLDQDKVLVTFKVVGTTFHQDAIDELLAKAMPDFHSEQNGQRELTYNNSIILIPEPDNQYDPNAVKVFVQFLNQPLPIGYLGIEFNWLYLKLINELKFTLSDQPSLQIIQRDPICVGNNEDGTPKYEEFNDEFLGQFILYCKSSNICNIWNRIDISPLW